MLTEGQDYTIEFFAKILLFVWVVLLLPWFVFAPLSGMAFDSGNTLSAWVFVLFTWSYGPAVFAAFKLMDRTRKFVLLPLISIAGAFLPDLIASLLK